MKYSLKIKLKVTDKPDKSGNQPLFIQYIAFRKRVLLSTGLKINPIFWNADAQRINIRYDSHRELNKSLAAKFDIVEQLIEQHYLKHSKYPNSAQLKQLLGDTKTLDINTLNEQISLKKLWKDYIDTQTLRKVRPSTIQIYRQTWDKWLLFSASNDAKYTYKDINFPLLENFRIFLLNKNYQRNTRGKAIKTIKSFFNYLLEMKELPINPNFKKVKTEKEENEITTFSLLELESLKREVLYSTYPGYATPKFALSEIDTLVGRIMVFLCNTGLSFVDFKNLKVKHLIFNSHDNIPTDLQLQLTRTKVDTARCIIPILDGTIDIIMLALGIEYFSSLSELKDIPYQDKVQILNDFLIKNRADGALNDDTAIFPKITNQAFNKKIKTVLQEIKIDSLVQKITGTGADKTETLVPKYAQISSHTGRRTYITLSYQNGNDTSIIMKTTGHVKVETLNRYNKISHMQIQDVIKRNTIKQYSQMSVLSCSA